jgi:uncharacterized protein YndB with AHSA1/START domain
MDSWATLETIGGKAVLRFERQFAHSPEKVFRAISDGAELAHWFPATVEMELRTGAAIRFEFPDADVDAPGGEVLDVDPPRLLVYTWGNDVLRWEIVPEGGGCRLHFTHTVTGDDDWPARLQAARHAAGWDVCLAALEARLEVGKPGEPDWFAREEAYLERFGLADGDLREHAGGTEVRFRRDVVHPADAIWTTLTDGHEPALGDEPPPGFTAGDFDAGAITAVEPAHLLEYEWKHQGTVAGRVRWELRELDFGSGLILAQTLPDPDLGPVALAPWKEHLQRLVAALHGDGRLGDS